MHGLIVEGLQRYVAARGGEEMWQRVTAEHDATFARPDGGRVFGDDDVAAIVAAAAGSLGCSVVEFHEEFGRFLAPLLLGVARPIADSNWGALDLIEQTEALFHTTVRVSEPGSAPPILDVERTSPDALIVRYASPRRMCGVACGIIAGISEDYGETLVVTQPHCMHHGDPSCEIHVTRRP